jgi:hypothetical protein
LGEVPIAIGREGGKKYCKEITLEELRITKIN